MDTFIVFPKRGRMIWFGICSLILILIAGVFYGVAESIGNMQLLWLKIICIISIIIFGLCLLFYIKALINRKPALIVTDEGIIDHSSYIYAGMVKWKQIEHIDFINYGGQVFLGIYTYDPELIIARTSGFKSILNKVNTRLLPAQVHISVKNLNCSIDELVDQITLHRAKAKEIRNKQRV